MLAPCKGIDDSFHTVDSGFRVLNSGFQHSGFRIPKSAGLQFFFSAGLRIPIVSGTPDSKAHDSGFQKRKTRGLWDPHSLTWGENARECRE